MHQEAVVFPGHSTISWAVAVAAFAVGGPFSATVSGCLADTHGWHGALLIVTWTFLLGGLKHIVGGDEGTAGEEKGCSKPDECGLAVGNSIDVLDGKLVVTIVLLPSQ